jgi:hypothetical protein
MEYMGAHKLKRQFDRPMLSAKPVDWKRNLQVASERVRVGIGRLTVSTLLAAASSLVLLACKPKHATDLCCPAEHGCRPIRLD